MTLEDSSFEGLKTYTREESMEYLSRMHWGDGLGTRGELSESEYREALDIVEEYREEYPVTNELMDAIVTNLDALKD